MNWTGVPVHMIDFEGCTRSGIVEFGVVTLVGGAIKSRSSRLCSPTGPIWTEDTRVHGLRRKELRGRAPFSDEWEMFAGLRETGVLAAHFAATERRLLCGVWPYPRTSPDFLRPGRSLTEWGPWIDTGRLAIEFQPDLPSAALEDVVHALGLSSDLEELADQHCPDGRNHFHCAPYDALAAALVLMALAHDQYGAPFSLQRLVEDSTADTEKRNALQQEKLF